MWRVNKVQSRKGSAADEASTSSWRRGWARHRLDRRARNGWRFDWRLNRRRLEWARSARRWNGWDSSSLRVDVHLEIAIVSRYPDIKRGLSSRTGGVTATDALTVRQIHPIPFSRVWISVWVHMQAAMADLQGGSAPR
jgi:hypothetical protein